MSLSNESLSSDVGSAPAGVPVGFAITLPDSWLELDVRPSTRDANIAALVERQVREQPELWEHRGELVKLLRRQARDAWEAGAVYCACFAMAVEGSIIPGSLTVTVLPPPPAGSAADAIAELLTTKEAREDGDTWMLRSLVNLPDAGRAARAQGVTDVELPGGGWLRTILMQTFVPVDGDRILLVAGASPALDLAEPLLELFDTITSTLTLVRETPAA